MFPRKETVHRGCAGSRRLQTASLPALVESLEKRLLLTVAYGVIDENLAAPIGPVLAGFDTRAYPTDQVMKWLRQNTNLSWVGYYLYPAPSRNNPDNGGASWMGQFPSLSYQQWNVA